MASKELADTTAAMGTCAWCARRIPPDAERFCLGAKARPGVDLGPCEGGVITLALVEPRRTVTAIVPTRDSQARREGNDLLFAVCSQTCGRALRAALQHQLDLTDPRPN
ncbi:MAG: hypothetical protein AB1505_11715 [Candidatus Latescibacterota bacterium]